MTIDRAGTGLSKRRILRRTVALGLLVSATVIAAEISFADASTTPPPPSDSIVDAGDATATTTTTSTTTTTVVDDTAPPTSEPVGSEPAGSDPAITSTTAAAVETPTTVEASTTVPDTVVEVSAPETSAPPVVDEAESAPDDAARSAGAPVAPTVNILAAAAPTAAATQAVTLAAPATVPLNAGGVRAVAGNGLVSISWNAPVSNGGAPILRFLVQRSTNAAGGWTTATSTGGRSAVVAGLRNGVRYYFRVIAVNAIGNSAPSWWAAAVPSSAASTLPPSPRAVFSTVGDRRMTVAWSAPVTGGSPVLAYRVQIASLPAGPWVTVRWTSASVHGVIFTGLRNGTRYYARVISVNRYGAGRPSAATSNIPVPPRPPGAPAGLRASVGDGRITVAWNTPTNNGGAAVLTYRVQLSAGVGGSWVTLKWIPASTHGVVLSGLRNGTRYYARVIAVNSGGPGAPSAPISATPQAVRSATARVPGGPAGLRASVGDGRVTVAWNTPTSNGGSAILTYRVQLASSASGPWMNSKFVPASTHGVSITGLKNGTRYWARVIAVNAIGAGAPSAAITAVPAGASTLRPPTSTGNCTTAGYVPGAGDPFGGCWPGPANTGVRVGTVLTPYTGPCTITVANTVIDSKIISCELLIRANNVTIRNSHITGGAVHGLERDGASFRIEDSWIDNGQCVNCSVDGWNFTILRTEITGSNRGAYCMHVCEIRDSWIHGTVLDPNSEAHASAVRVEQYATLVHNTLGCDYTGPFNNSEIGCSADMSGYADFAAIHNNTINGNLFMANPVGLGFCAYGGNTSGKPSSGDPANGTYIVFSNNVFQRGSNGKCGSYGAVTDFDTGGTGNTWFNNLWSDGATVAPG